MTAIKVARHPRRSNACSRIAERRLNYSIRTFGNPLRRRPSGPLVATMLAVVAVALALPFTPGAAILGFSALPASFSAFLAAETATYLIIVEIAKRWLLRGTALYPGLISAAA